MKTLLSFGHGYSARALARLLPRSDWKIIGTTRSKDKSWDLMSDDITPVVWPGDDLTKSIATASHILVSAAPTADGDPVLADWRDAIRAAPNLEWVGYLSTTGVYGDHQGGWVDENTPLAPSTKRGKLRVSAEAEWQDMGLPLHIFRLAGIYGPGRGPFAKVRNGTARRIIKKNQLFSRIHVDDIAQILDASIRLPNPGRIYNVCDGQAAPPEDVISHAADLLGFPLPEEVDFETAEMTPMARSFYAESKRVRNDRILKELRVELKYPNYRAGLAALLKEEQYTKE
ncbi:MAG: SDR family oxidoreductase [Litoreibacter sp.]